MSATSAKAGSESEPALALTGGALHLLSCFARGVKNVGGVHKKFGIIGTMLDRAKRAGHDQ